MTGTRGPHAAVAGPPVALITGCSSGFGLGLTVALAEQGWRVIATMRDVTRRVALDAALAGGQLAERVELVPLDVTDGESIDNAIATLRELTERIDVVIHNAGVAVTSFFEDLPGEAQERLLATNLVGAMNLTRGLLPTMRGQGGGRIVVISSQAVFASLPGLSVYAASKAGVEAWAEALAVEVAPFGIEVRIIQPGGFRTDLGRNMDRLSPEDSPYHRLASRMFARIDALERRFLGDPEAAIKRMLPVITGRSRRLRTVVGRDAKAMWLLRHAAPWPARRRLAQALMGFPRLPREARPGQGSRLTPTKQGRVS